MGAIIQKELPPPLSNKGVRQSAVTGACACITPGDNEPVFPGISRPSKYDRSRSRGSGFVLPGNEEEFLTPNHTNNTNIHKIIEVKVPPSVSVTFCA
jgi:hypothetical protein